MGLNAITGEVLWTTNAGTHDNRFSPQTDGTTVYSMKSVLCAAAVFASCVKGTPIALNPQTGDVLWDSRYSGEDEPLVAAGSLYFADLFEGFQGRSGFMAIDKATAEINFIAREVNTV